MNKKEFVKLFNPVKNKEKIIKLCVFPQKGDKLKLECGIFLISVADSTKTIYISNSLSYRNPCMNARRFLKNLPNDSYYDDYNITANISAFSGKINRSLMIQKLNDKNVFVKECNNFVKIIMHIEEL